MKKRSQDPKRILVRAPNWIGDQIMAFPFFHYLRKAYPDAHIAVVCVEWVDAVQFRSLVNEIFLLPRPIDRSLKEKLIHLEVTARRLRAQGPWDLGIALPNSFSAAWLLFRARVRRRRGYQTEGRSLLLTERVEWDPNPARHRTQAYVDLLPSDVRPERETLEFWGIPAENELDEDIPGELKSFDVRAEWSTTERVEPLDEPYWVLAPGATAESRRWSLESYAALARQVVAETGWRGVVIGGPKEALLADQLCADSSLRLVDRTARGSVTGLAPLFAQARFTVCNESGLAHVASLCGSFVQIICGAADPRRTRPLGPGKVQVVINPVECWPCERNTCALPTGEKFQCLRGIYADTVWEEIKRGIRFKPAKQ